MGLLYWNHVSELETEELLGIEAVPVNVVLFGIEGDILEAYCDGGELVAGRNVCRYMSETEWRYLRKCCLSFDCNRVFADTSLGGMVVFCHLLASMRVMIGVIFRGRHEEVARFYRERSIATDKLSPRMHLILRRISHGAAERGKEIDELSAAAIRAFSAGVLLGELERNASEAGHLIGESTALWARLLGCCVKCRPTGETVTEVHDFYGNAFWTIVTNLLFFLRRGFDRTAELEVFAFEGRPLIVFCCRLPMGEQDIFVNRAYRFEELKRCDDIAEAWQFFFACNVFRREEEPWLRVSFCPKALPYEGLHIKEPRKKWKDV